ncbi:PP2C family protein-serine/threonine phosphatase [Maricaulis parjimensis]|uniref:PP2C family protein-serine/threonine phosphatase n=1 Tax=Maricaulis parjimensis TaxID=144023 RepID=UPI001939BD40|nr:fused response regulator/phosphatase [Maricaulis parjimensis]
MTGHSDDGARDADDGVIHAARILIVDDLDSSRLLIAQLLKSAGFHNLHFAEDGASALASLSEALPDMVVLDIVMPGMDGFEVCRRIRRDFHRDMPVLMQTGMQDADYRLHAFEAGASDIVSKPIDAGELVSRVRLHLERRRLMSNLQVYRHRMEEDLRVAQAMQHSLLMTEADVEAIVAPRRASLSTFYRASNTLGGDLWQVFPVDATRFGLFMVDLSGHGVSAAINAFRVHMLAGRMSDLGSRPDAWMRTLNLMLVDMLPVEQFATAFYGLVDIPARSLKYAAAGAPPPLHFSAEGNWTALDGSGVLLGCNARAEYPVRECPLGEGDRLFVYSDALYENFDNPDASLEADALADAVRTVLPHTGNFADNLLSRLFGAPDAPLHDDLTWMLMEVQA